MVYLSSSLVMMCLVGCFSMVTWSFVDGAEVCDGEDNDLDGSVDEDFVQYADMDGDGFGDAAAAVVLCEEASGFVLEDGDCDDGDASVNPKGVEVCDGVDNDCDGVIDNDAVDARTYYVDEDGDGYGDEGAPGLACEVPPGVITVGGDCDDGDASVNPSALELCNSGVDEDCDGSAAPCGVEGALTDGDADYTILGASDSFLGYDMTVGDLNGDGADDLVVGAHHTDVSASLSSAGAVYVIYGPIDAGLGLPTDADFSMTGVAVSDYVGRAISAGGDVDGDGVDDLLVAANFYDPEDRPAAGGVALVYGSAGGRTGSLTFTAGDAVWEGAASSDSLGTAAQIIGDFDGDGYDDFVLGGQEVDLAGLSSGGVYLFAGSATRYSGTVNTSTAAMTISGASAGDQLGGQRSVSGRVDLDGDGLSELVFGAKLNDDAGTSAGAVYLVYGNMHYMGAGALSVTANIADAVFTGANGGDTLGEQVSGIGDTDGDGYDELIFGSSSADPRGVSGAGCAWLLPGGGAGYSGTDHIDSDASAQFCGVGTTDSVGQVTYGGDLNGDAYMDVVVAGSGVDTASTSYAGAAYVFFGPVSGGYFTTEADASFSGSKETGYMGVGGAIMDYDGDGADDLLIGACGADSAYVWRGGGL